MKVVVIFEFQGVEINSPDADVIVDEITETTVQLSEQFGTPVYVDDAYASTRENTAKEGK